MTRISEKRIRKSPLLVSSLHKNWDTFGNKQKMIRLSVRKLRKIGDPETLLCRAVLINNTLETVKNSSQSPTSNTNLERSQYNEDEERILSTVRIPSVQDNKGAQLNTTITLPEPISPLSDDEESYSNLYSDLSHNIVSSSPGSLSSQHIHKSGCLQLTDTENFNNSMNCASNKNNEYLFEDDRAIFNSYLSLCSSDLYDCKSIIAA